GMSIPSPLVMQSSAVNLSPSPQEIELVSSGAVARYGPHTANFAPTLSTPLDLQMPDGKHLRSHIAGLAYYIPGGQSVLIAELTNTVGLVLSPSQVIYTNTFDDVRADVLYTYTKNSFEQDIILRCQLPSPTLWGLDPAAVRLAVLSECVNPPQPQTYSVPIDLSSLNAAAGIQAEGTLPDQLIVFNSMYMGRGRAFTIGTTGEDIPVGKSWQYFQDGSDAGRWFLVESTPYLLLKQQLDNLPPDTGALYKPRKTQAFRTALLSLPVPQLASAPQAKMAAGTPMNRASVKPALSSQASPPKGALAKVSPLAPSLEGPGVVLDYIIINTSVLNVQFGPGTTKTGPAAAGQSSGDVWNWYLAPGSSLVTMNDLAWSDGTDAGVSMTVSNAPGQWYNPVDDPMYQAYIYQSGTVTITLTNLPASTYDFYFYGHGAANDQNGRFHLYTGTNDHGTLSTTNTGSTSWTSDNWTENVQYVVFRGISVASNDLVKLLILPDSPGYAIINGMQIAGDPRPLYFVTQPADQIVTEGDNVTFAPVVAGSQAGYQWYYNGSLLSSATNLSLSFTNVHTSQSGSYYVAITDYAGVTNSRVASLFVNYPQPADVPSGLVGWWPGNNNANDVTNGDNGSLQGGATYSTGKVLESFSFNGTDSHVDIPKTSALDVGGQVTIEFWMNADPSNPIGSTIQGLVTSDFYGVEIDADPGVAGVNFWISGDNGNSWTSIADDNGGSVIFPSGEWHHIAGTYDGTNLQMYLDGQAWGFPVAASGNISPMGDSSFVTLGSEDGRNYCPDCVANRYFNGLIDEVSIYNRALTASEIKAIYDASYTGKWLDSNHDGVPDWWCYQYGLNPDVTLGNDTYGRSLKLDYIEGRNPNRTSTIDASGSLQLQVFTPLSN